MSRQRVSHPVIWTILYLPFGAVSGFVSVALTFLATKHGLTITEAAFLPAASLVSQWLKWLWAPAVDVTLTPKKWYLIGTVISAIGVLLLAITPMSQDTLPLLVVVVASVSLLRSFIGMGLEALVAALTPKEEQGRVSAWFQVGNLGGSGLGGGLGLTLLEVLPAWLAGTILAALFGLCALALLAVPHVEPHRVAGGPLAATKGVVRDIGRLIRTKGGLLVTVLCFMPLGTGAAQGVLTQAEVADVWGATATHVALVQGYTGAVAMAAGCFVGGWLCNRFRPRTAYVQSGLLLAACGAAMAVVPATVEVYVVGNLIYAVVVGMCYATWTAAVLNAMGARSAATKYTLFASMSNFPIWWLGLLLGIVADFKGAFTMLWAEAGIAVAGVVVFLLANKLIARTRLPDDLIED